MTPSERDSYDRLGDLLARRPELADLPFVGVVLLTGWVAS
jgi:hypothetical protein